MDADMQIAPTLPLMRKDAESIQIDMLPCMHAKQLYKEREVCCNCNWNWRSREKEYKFR